MAPQQQSSAAGMAYSRHLQAKLYQYSASLKGSVGRLCAACNDANRIVVGQNAWNELYMYRIQPLELQFDLLTPGRHRRRADCL